MITNTMPTRRGVLEMFQDEDAETDILAKGLERNGHCILEPNADLGITALEGI